ncbi:hypothetical protein [Streptomyces sp. NPDC056323]|uniref:nSTAND1 domain-containing NTPase n=1 Tax=unclassified Streptomyces TaxID=2593676 RepID=UPI0035E3692A
MARGKLVVLSRAQGSDEHEEIVDLAHEALTIHWPLLRRWLTESRDFRLWQEQQGCGSPETGKASLSHASASSA